MKKQNTRIKALLDSHSPYQRTPYKRRAEKLKSLLN